MNFPAQQGSRNIAGVSLITALFLFPGAFAEGVDFEKEIKPFLEKKCLGCHNPNIAKGDVILAGAGHVFAEGSELIVRGDALKSDLYLVATPAEPGEIPEMPEEGDALTDAEAALLKTWIDEGAVWPDELVLHEASKSDKSWWAYQPLSDSPHQSIDAFIEAGLRKEGLAMNPPADRRVLIRRATYDLTGLPPTQEDVTAFVNDSDPDAYPKLIDRLLASPRYGERWGRHWLDVVRFGESKGYERNVIIDNAWPFRDYVIDSINDDKPFDQFIREHVAGDVFGAGDPEVEIGSAFLVGGPYDDVGNKDVVAAAQIRANTLDEIISATGEAFLGMTIGCARCHDHKFDPISHRDYYSLYATFSGVRHNSRPLASPEATAAREAALKPLNAEKVSLAATLKKLEGQLNKRVRSKLPDYEKRWVRPKVSRTLTEETFAPVRARFVRLVSEALDTNPNNAAGFRIDEFEIFSSGENPRNVALLSNGATATGAARSIEDFPGAYGPQLAIDGKLGARFVSTGTDLTIELPEVTEIDRVVFSSGRNEETFVHGKFAFVADYRIEVSDDGKKWREVAHGRDRKPVSASHEMVRLRRGEATREETDAIQLAKSNLAAVDRKIAAVPALPSVWLGTRSKADAKGPFHIFLGGSPQKKGERVVAASLSTLSEVAPLYELAPEADEAARRSALADWIVDEKNPLSLRVLANRIWHYHFGTGIVETPNDFGYMGGRPSHPELLDFLARRLQENGWKLKPMHREVMLSKAYQQSSTWNDAAGKVDGESRLLWRFPPRRLSAEEIRDTVLAVSGQLDLKMGGPGFRLYKFMQDNVCTYEPLDEHGPETYRRAVYHQNARASVVDLMTEFDQADCSFSTPKRSETTTPLQALTLLNHQFTMDMAKGLAAAIGKRGGNPVTSAFELAYQRAPAAEELAQSEKVINEHGIEAFCRALLNSSELIYLD
ncbi:MAG: DUF1553 domain-containing protein [Verrucomicrobiales bacterium]|nr:DUF1553 domain-containing protein [Verrucomicrobiales bacterium]